MLFFLQFIKTPEFKALKAWVEDDGSSDEDSPEQAKTNPTLPPGLDDEVGRVHVTKSQAANEHPRRPNERPVAKQ